MDELCKLLPAYDCSSLQVNLLTGLIFLILSVLVSLTLIPRITVWLIKKNKRKFENQRIAFIISELCWFFDTNSLPVYKDSKALPITLNSSPEEIRFLGTLPNQLFNELGRAQLVLSILQLGDKFSPENLINILDCENKRIEELEKSLENLLSVHGFNLSNKVVQKISTLCFQIKNYRRYYSLNSMVNNLNFKRPGVFGLGELSDLYKEILNICLYFIENNKKNLKIT